MAFDYVRIAFFDECRESPQCVSLGFFYVVRIDDDQFLPSGVVRKSDAHDVLGVTAPICRKHLKLHSFEFFEREILEQRASSRSEIMLNRIGQREEIAAGILESVAKRNQFLPAIDCDEPAVF